jgi:hypothetical protein
MGIFVPACEDWRVLNVSALALDPAGNGMRSPSKIGHTSMLGQRRPRVQCASWILDMSFPPTNPPSQASTQCRLANSISKGNDRSHRRLIALNRSGTVDRFEPVLHV